MSKQPRGGTKPPLHLQSLEKMNKRRDLQQQLMEAKLQQADALLADAEEKHKREKEYVSRKRKGRKGQGKGVMGEEVGKAGRSSKQGNKWGSDRLAVGEVEAGSGSSRKWEGLGRKWQREGQ